jgi:hypothetical protein
MKAELSAVKLSKMMDRLRRWSDREDLNCIDGAYAYMPEEVSSSTTYLKG